MSKRISKSHKWTTAALTLATAFVLCGGPEIASAQQNPAPPAQQTIPAPGTQNSQAPDQQNAQATQQQTDTTQQQPGQGQAQEQQQSQSEAAAQQQHQQTSRPGMVDPSQGPLTPAPSSNEAQQPPAMTPDNLPDAPSASQQQQQQQAPDTTAPIQKPKPRTTQPVGVGTAQEAPTAGGAASKPAGAAIAPAKQKQYRSLLIKIGAIAGAGAALGTVFALSRGTKSTPPGAGR